LILQLIDLLFFPKSLFTKKKSPMSGKKGSAIMPGTVIFLALGILAAIAFSFIAKSKTKDPTKHKESIQ
jgi:hypothetical protein